MTQIPPFITMFPEPSQVFADRIDEHAAVLFPLFSINLNSINRTWTGELHMLYFNEDLLNRDTLAYFNEYCKDGMIAFDVTEGKYSFKSNLRYFEITPEWNDLFRRTKESFQETRQLFFDSGDFMSASPDKGMVFEQLGGNPLWLQSEATPCDLDGTPMYFITRVRSSSYVEDNLERDTYLFYSLQQKIAVVLYQTPRIVNVKIVSLNG